MQLISKLAIFAGSVTGITALTATYAYSQSANSIETKEEKEVIDKEKLVVPEVQKSNEETKVVPQKLQEESQQVDEDLIENEEFEICLL